MISIKYFSICFALAIFCTNCFLSSRIITRTEMLDFSKCIIASEGFEFLEIDMPRGYKKELHQREGLCEYRFIYKDSVIAYISNDVWYGSLVNVENRRGIGHDTYIKDHLLDTISVNGSTDGFFWEESIVGDVMFGFINATAEQKTMFNDAFSKLRKY